MFVELYPPCEGMVNSIIKPISLVNVSKFPHYMLQEDIVTPVISKLQEIPERSESNLRKNTKVKVRIRASSLDFKIRPLIYVIQSGSPGEAGRAARSICP